MSTVVKTPTFCIYIYAKTKAQISIAVSAKLISAFVFGSTKFLYIMTPVMTLTYFIQRSA